jgi:hypothetical protein
MIPDDHVVRYESAALALGSSGKVLVMLPPEGLAEDTAFTLYEWPNLFPPGNSRVTEIAATGLKTPYLIMNILRSAPRGAVNLQSALNRPMLPNPSLKTQLAL